MYIPTIVCISGKAGSGKDYFASQFKDFLQEMNKKVLIVHYADLVKYCCTQFFGWNGVKDTTGRTLLQTFGTDIVRAQYPNYWVKFVMDMVRFSASQNYDYVLIPDTRFPNEISRWEEYGYRVKWVKIERTSNKYLMNKWWHELTDTQKSHASETALDNFNHDCYVLKCGEDITYPDIQACYFEYLQED